MILRNFGEIQDLDHLQLFLANNKIVFVSLNYYQVGRPPLYRFIVVYFENNIITKETIILIMKLCQ